MAKVVVFNVPFHGHVNPSLPVVAELVRRSERVTYFVTEEFRATVEATGATFRAYQNFPAGLGDSVKEPIDLALQMVDACRVLVPEVVDVLNAERPDYVIFDSMTPWAWMAARRLGIPLVSSMALLALHPRVLLSAGNPLPLVAALVRSMPKVRAYNQKAARLERDLSMIVPKWPAVLDMPGDLSIVYTSRQFHPMPHLFDNSYKFVGPSPFIRPIADAFPFDQLGTKPLIYISLGTVNNQARDFYAATFDAFGDGPYQVVLTVGRQTEIASLGKIPSNFIVRNFVPQWEIVPRAALFINHGGMNSVHDSLLEGVPLVVVPQQMEQSIVAQQVKRLGAGVVIKKEQATATRLREAAASVLNNPSYRENAKKAGDSLRQAGGYARAADEIFAFVHHSVPTFS